MDMKLSRRRPTVTIDDRLSRRKDFTMHRLAILLALSIAAPAAAQDRFDVLIRGGRVLDGTGNPWYRADVGVRDGRIVAMGRLGGAPAGLVIDAGDLYVAPGFIDVHSHADEGLDREELKGAAPILLQGVTTAVLNPDGGGPWPLSEQRARYEAHGIGVNAALMVGHGTVRREVMGMEDRPPTEDELKRMKAMVREGMAAGAFGLSSGLYYAPGELRHDRGGRSPCEGSVSDWGLHQSHPRRERLHGRTPRGGRGSRTDFRRGGYSRDRDSFQGARSG